MLRQARQTLSWAGAWWLELTDLLTLFMICKDRKYDSHNFMVHCIYQYLTHMRFEKDALLKQGSQSTGTVNDATYRIENTKKNLLPTAKKPFPPYCSNSRFWVRVFPSYSIFLALAPLLTMIFITHSITNPLPRIALRLMVMSSRTCGSLARRYTERGCHHRRTSWAFVRGLQGADAFVVQHRISLFA